MSFRAEPLPTLHYILCCAGDTGATPIRAVQYVNVQVLVTCPPTY